MNTTCLEIVNVAFKYPKLYIFSFKIQVFANHFKLTDDHKADLAAIRIASVNPILDPWIYILLRRSLFRRLLALSRPGGRSSRRRSAYMYPELTTDGHVFTHLVFSAHVISQLPDAESLGRT